MRVTRLSARQWNGMVVRPGGVGLSPTQGAFPLSPLPSQVRIGHPILHSLQLKVGGCNLHYRHTRKHVEKELDIPGRR